MNRSMNGPVNGIVLLGFGGHARSVADVALSAGFDRLLFVDENAREGETYLGFAVVRTLPPLSEGWQYMPCAGDNRRRMSQLERMNAAGLPLATVISPHATVGHDAAVGNGTFIAHHAHAGPSSRIGAGCILNTGAIVEHDCAVGFATHVSVNAAIAGRSRVGNYVFLGVGAIVIDGVSIANDVVIGAGGVVISSIDVPGTYVGVPVKRVAVGAHPPETR